MKKKWLIIVILLFLTIGISFAAENDYQTLRTFMSAKMYGEAYNELMQRELTGLKLDSKLKSLKVDLLDRTYDKLLKQAKVSPDDATLFTILADIAFQKGDLDRATNYISTAISNEGKAITNYTFAKILFRKGNISQAFEQMSIVLQEMPHSTVVFNDFQFLYTCKQYGVNTAKKLSQDSSFIERATPIADEDEKLEVPQSPFSNDPTPTTDSPDFSNYNLVKNKKTDESDTDFSDNDEVGDELEELSKIDVSSDQEKDEDNELTSKLNEKSLDEDDDKVGNKGDDIDSSLSDDFEISDSNDSIKEPEKKLVIKSEDNNEKKDIVEDDNQDPELKKMELAASLFASAQAKFKDGNLENALTNLKELEKIDPNYEGKEKLKLKIKYIIDLRKRYKEAKKEFEKEDFDDYEQARKVFIEAYNFNPKEFYEAPFYIGKCYAYKEDPDFDQALKYYNMIIDDSDVDPEMNRDLKWEKLIILYDQKQDYEEANELFNYFLNEEETYAKKQPDFKRYRYGLWLKLYKIPIIIVTVITFIIIITVFLLQFMPDIALLKGEPVPNSQNALSKGNYKKAISIAEKALIKKQPIQIDRLLREVLVQAYFNTGDFEKCQFHAKTILKNFPDNQIAWSHLSKAAVQAQDTSNEAVRMYEDMYRNDPSRKDLLPLLASSYINNKDTSPSAMDILVQYHEMQPDDAKAILALAECYIKNRIMSQDTIPILNDALKLDDKVEYRELLARTFSKCELYEEASRECITLLNRNINNIGIHVVYTSSMKKLNQIPKAIAQYKDFIKENPGNNQLVEILDGLKKEVGDVSSPVDDVNSMTDSLGLPGMDIESNEANSEESIPSDLPSIDENFLKSPIQNTNSEAISEPVSEPVSEPSTPIPDFIASSNLNSQETTDTTTNNNSASTEDVASIDLPNLPDGIQTLNPFAENYEQTGNLPPFSENTPDSNDLSTENDSLFDGFDTEELPEELGGTSRAPIESSSSLDSIVNGFSDIASSNDFALPPSVEKTVTSMPSNGAFDLQKKIEDAKLLSYKGEWDNIINILSPEFASVRNKEAGMLLIEAWIGKEQPEMALEIIEALDIDPEMMGEDIKEALYNTAIALENNKKYSQALKLYDKICNADINYKDAFDRSDKLYVKIKG